jgi:Uncharacterized conserved protein
MSEEAASREITITRLFDAPRDLVFQAWTEPDRISKWWGPEGFFAPSVESDPRPGGSLMIVMRGLDGVDYKMTGIFKEVQAPERLVVESTALDLDGKPVLTAMNTVTFQDKDGKTEVTVHARAVALVPDAAGMLGGMLTGWTQSLQCLDDVLTGAIDRQIVTMRVFQATRDRVFEAWTQRDQIEKWWGPTGFTVTIDQMDVRPGGTWLFTMHGPDGVDYPNVIVYEEIVSPERLVYKHGSPDTDDAGFRTTVTFDDFMGMTALTMRGVFPTAEARDVVVEKYHAIEGAGQTLDRLGELLEATADLAT